MSVCLFSRVRGMGGMIHYALPRAPQDVSFEDSFRYGDLAIASLIEELCVLTGDRPSSFEAKIVGGAVQTEHHSPEIQAGPGNIEIARRLLAQEHIPIVGEDVGGSSGRRIRFYTESGRLQVSDMKKSEADPGDLSTLLNAVPRPSVQSSPFRKKVKVLIVDDSKTIRDLLKRILEQDPDLEVVGQAEDAFEAMKLLEALKPDVITLDIHMPKMTGVEWLAQLLPKRPIPVVMISSLQMQEGNEVFRALELGAVDYIQKPSLSELGPLTPVIQDKVKAASMAKVRQQKHRTQSRILTGDVDLRTVLAIGASTGGTEALKEVMCALPERIPPTVIVQHIPPVFSRAFADRLNQLCPFEVKEAADGDELKVSRVLIAPGAKQMKIEPSPHGFRVRITDDDPVNRHKPSVDYLFHSVAQLIGSKAVGVILTGMGADGAKGLLAMRKQGAQTIGQDEESSVVYGMPRAAAEIGAVQQVASLGEIPRLILKALEKRRAS